ncbi:transporter substrate-binding domain-containing protein [Mailhella massiliensis]|uniref:Transporter substrate-binding domain-containing protein n=1 Tax=Mailhella massiliensis TaxID=1903261 RepID=A0A921AUU9_9BACT|nr:transporter substrate-binding domain-containing protein [Mailhella massiliensis]HJD96316.1 transporter substrate-binding domain-containing protein [Mailhella massiliensis]
MKHCFAVFLLALGLVFSVPSQGYSADRESVMEKVVRRGTLRVGFSSFVPWAMQDKEGKYIGFEIDVAERLAQDLGVRLQLVPTNWDGIIPALLSGKFDVIIGSMSITPQRLLSVNFSIPYDHAYVDLTLNREKSAAISKIEDLNAEGVTIAVRTGTTAAAAAAKLFPKATLRMFNDEAPAVEEVLSGRAHAFVSSAPLPAMETLKHGDILVQKFETGLAMQPVAFAVPKGDFDTLNVFDGWIRLVEEEGWLQDRRNYWFKSDAWQSRIN